MKKLTIGTVMLGIMYISIIMQGLNSCKSNSTVKHKVTDTLGPVTALYHILGGKYDMAVAKYTISEMKVLDTSSMQGKTVADTNWILLIPNPKDSVRDLKGKPKYDSAAKSFIFNKVWYPVVGQEKQTVKIQIINI
jgi:hypothetical protein